MTVRPAPDSARLEHSAALRDWLPSLVMIGFAAFAFALTFWREGAGAVRVWIDSTAYNHCFLILPLIGFLLWERRATIRSVAPLPAVWPLLLIPPLTVLWLVAASLDILEGRQLVMMAMFEVVLLVALGPYVFRLLLAPLLFLFFLVPSGAFLVPYLQNITAAITIGGLHWLNIPVYTDGLTLEIPEGTFEIAEACAGLRFLIASIVFGCFFSVMMYRSRVRRAAFIALSAVVPVAANGVRALGIVVLAHIIGNAAAIEADHVLYGWIFFTIVILLLIAIGMGFTQRDPAPVPLRAPVERAFSPWLVAIAVPVAVLLAVMGPAYAAWLDRHSGEAVAAAAAPSVAPPWQMRPEAAPNWHPVVFDADREFLGSYESPDSGQVIAYTAFYRLRAIGSRLTASDNRIAEEHRWHVSESGSFTAPIAGRQTTVRRWVLADGRARRLAWSFFVVDGTITDRPLIARLLQAQAVLLRRAPVAAFVAVSTGMADSPFLAEARLTSFLAADRTLADYVAGSSEHR